MSGHSKWSSIKHKKGAADAKRGKIFTKHAKLIEIAAREGGGGDPSTNSQLKAAIDNAKAENVPNANIDRAVKKGSGELKGEATVGVTYEAYGPGGIACIIECLTDNKNRTIANVRSTIEKKGGKWAESGSVAFMFDRKGVVTAEKESDIQEDTQLELMDLGAEDFDIDGTRITVTSDINSWTAIRDALKAKGFTIAEAGLKFVAQQPVAIDDMDAAKKAIDFIEQIEEDDDVSDVHSNMDLSDEVVAALTDS